MLILRDMSKNYQLGKETIPVLKDLNLTINQGEFISIMGPSGCGKTTLLNLLSGMDQVSGGTIEFHQKRIDRNNDKQWSAWRKSTIGYIFQNFNLIEFLTAKQNIELVLQLNGVRKKDRSKKTQDLLEMVGLGDRGKHLPAQLSGGQKQRVAIARALANHPQMLLADEPTGSMDSVASREIIELLRKINRENNLTIIMVTHDERIANQTQRKITMLDGRIISDESLNTIKGSVHKQESKEGKSFFFSELLIAFRNMATKKKRTLLTSIGTSIGIAGVLLVCGIGSGAKERIMEELNTVVNMQIVDVVETDVSIDQKLQDQLLLDKDILDIYPNNRPEVYCQYGEKVGSGLVHPIGPIANAKEYWKERLIYGTIPENDNSMEAVITLTMAEKLIGGDDVQSILGKEIDMAFLATSKTQLSVMVIRKVKIVGISGTAFLGVTDIVNIPYLIAEQVVKESLGDETYRPNAYCVTVVNERRVKAVKDMLNRLGLKASIDIEAMGSIGIVVDLVTAVIMLLAGISLVVSGIMIALVTYMGVTERTREIGILRAIGFSAHNIKSIFLIEGGTVGLLAGVIGIICSTLLGVLINQIVLVSFSEIAFTLYKVSIQQVMFCVLFSTLIGIICAYSPSRRASKMKPISALGYAQE